MTLERSLDLRSVLSTTPWPRSAYGKDSSGLVINQEKVCRLYVENWQGQDNFIPQGFIPDEKIRSLLVTGSGDATGSVISIGNPYVRFMMTTISTSFSETLIPMKNLTQGFVTYVFGQEPPTVSFSGILIHTIYDNWSEMFLAIYHYFLRASKLAELSIINNKKYQVVIRYQGKILKGSIINLQKSTNANNEQAVGFSFAFLLKELSFEWEPSIFIASRADIPGAITSPQEVTVGPDRTDVREQRGTVNSVKENSALS